jgi:hypothetical protein
MHVWNVIRAWFQERIQDMGVEETSFPMFLSSKSLEKVSNPPEFSQDYSQSYPREFNLCQSHFLRSIF